MLKLADECGAIAALRHAGKGQITTAAIDSMIFMGPVYVGERVEISAEVTYVGRTSIETRIEIFAEPIEVPERRKVAVGYALYVALDETGRRPRRVPPLLIEPMPVAVRPKPPRHDRRSVWHADPRPAARPIHHNERIGSRQETRSAHGPFALQPSCRRCCQSRGCSG